jgi:hypothetical protein
MLEKTEGKSKNGQSRDTRMTGTQDTVRRQAKHNDTTQKTKMMSNTDNTKTGGEHRCSRS